MIRLLAALLALQLIVTVVVYWPQQQGTVSAEALAGSLAEESIERIAIADGEGASNTLTREGDGWRLDSGLPADEGKVTTLLAALTRGDPGYAIATSDSAATRFRVADSDFERRITLSGSDGERVVYLGTSPSFRKIYARRDGEASVFVIELNSYDAPTTDGSWLDRALLAAEDLSTVELYGARFRRQDDRWLREDGTEADEEAMEALVQALSRLRVSGVAADDDEELDEAGEALRLTLGDGDSASRLTVLDNPDSERYYLSSDRFDPVFSTSALDAERLVDAARMAAGLPEANESGPEEPGSGDGADSAVSPGEVDGEASVSGASEGY